MLITLVLFPQRPARVKMRNSGSVNGAAMDIVPDLVIATITVNPDVFAMTITSGILSTNVLGMIRALECIKNVKFGAVRQFCYF